jgi:molybdopterin-guanine dinucleotide biosynthesis adapter protein
MKILGIAGYSGSGKTTLIEKLLPLLNAAGITVSVIKQSHHDITVDVEGKDSWRHRHAGAQETLLTSPHRWMLVGELRGAPEPTLNTHLARLSACDLVLVEGYKHAALAKLEVWRAANGKPWLYPDDDQFIATIADLKPDCALPYFNLNQPESVADFILKWIRS